ncbi:MAG: hypothetical protein C4K58_07830 [Flavobacteriaceae bacterium]|nr:MAG: hypothetical protein C4K58_07830 [Flavobacteriaceae bacterium]
MKSYLRSLILLASGAAFAQTPSVVAVKGGNNYIGSYVYVNAGSLTVDAPANVLVRGNLELDLLSWFGMKLD